MVMLPGGITLGTLLSVVGVYIYWLTLVEKMHERESRVRDALNGERFAVDDISFEVVRVTCHESDSPNYQIKKHIPLVRELCGHTEITLRSRTGEVSLRADGIGFEEYFWTRQGLDEFLDEGLPTVEHLNTDWAERTTETKLRIHSLDIAETTVILEEVPVYLDNILKEYPGDARFRINY